MTNVVEFKRKKWWRVSKTYLKPWWIVGTQFSLRNHLEQCEWKNGLDVDFVENYYDVEKKALKKWWLVSKTSLDDWWRPGAAVKLSKYLKQIDWIDKINENFINDYFDVVLYKEMKMTILWGPEWDEHRENVAKKVKEIVYKVKVADEVNEAEADFDEDDEVEADFDEDDEVEADFDEDDEVEAEDDSDFDSSDSSDVFESTWSSGYDSKSSVSELSD
jgi:hypothetical protein